MKAENRFQLRVVGVTAIGEPDFGRVLLSKSRHPRASGKAGPIHFVKSGSGERFIRKQLSYYLSSAK